MASNPIDKEKVTLRAISHGLVTSVRYSVEFANHIAAENNSGNCGGNAKLEMGQQHSESKIG
jgi:hypothetical protein